MSATDLETLQTWSDLWAHGYQLPPPGDWTTWLLLGGRGAGKTHAGAAWVRGMALGLAPYASKPVARIALVGESEHDVREVMIEGVSGILALHARGERPRWTPSRRRLEWQNGAVAYAFSAEDPESLRGPQFGAAWADELAKWRHADATFDMLQFGLRLGERPRQVITTTPRPIPLLKRLMSDPATVKTHARTQENALHLSPAFVGAVLARYRGTRLGRQEIDGEIIEERADALWSRAMIEGARVGEHPPLVRIVVAVDPPASSGKGADACGLVAVGRGENGCLALAPGDVVGFTANNRRRLMELRSLVDTQSRAVKAGSIDPEVFNLPLAPSRRRTPALPAPVGPVHAVVLDLPSIGAEMPPVLGRIAVSADPWPGPVAIWRSTDGASFDRADTAVAPSIIGVTLDPLPRGSTGRFDRTHTFRVQLYGGALASCSDIALFGGANAAAVQRSDGAWEILQFANAELVGMKTYALSRLLRGQSGSEWAMGAPSADPLPAGAPFVLLDAHLSSYAKGLDWLERPLQLRVVAASRTHGDPSAVAIDATPHATTLRPYAPVHVRGRRTGDGILLSWVRRTRSDGDSWEPVDVPLNEETEAYAIDILSGASVLRTLTASAPSLLYSNAQEIADFGTPQSQLSIAVAQLSASVGRGFAASQTILYLH